MAGYFKTTKDFYRKLWAWLELATSSNLAPVDLRQQSNEAHAYNESHYTHLLGYIRTWPDMPELGALKGNFDRAKAIADKNEIQDFAHCLNALRTLQTEMVKNGMGGR